MFSSGMEELGKVAVEGARVAAQGAGQLGRYANEQLNDPNLRSNVNDYVNSFSRKVNKEGWARDWIDDSYHLFT